MKEKKNYREFLYQERKRRNKSRDWLAAKAGISYNTVYLFETKKDYNYTIKTASRIARVLGYRLVIQLERADK